MIPTTQVSPNTPLDEGICITPDCESVGDGWEGLCRECEANARADMILLQEREIAQEKLDLLEEAKREGWEDVPKRLGYQYRRF